MPDQLATTNVISLCVLVWLFLLGSAVGSFMNVVIYRLPNGLSLLWPASRCPRCLTPLRIRDNIPILGWVALAGRCRYCRDPISRRYPLVELLVAALFVVLALVEPFSLSLPSGDKPMAIRITDDPLPWGRYAYHLTLGCALICAALIEHDGHGLPAGLARPVLCVGLLAPLLWPTLRALSATARFGNWVAPATPIAAFLDGLGGFVVALLVGRLIHPVAARVVGVREGSGAARRALCWIGAYLGWKAIACIGAATAMMYLIKALLSRFLAVARRLGWTSCLAVITLVWLLLAETPPRWWTFLTARETLVLLPTSLAAAVCLSWLAARFESV